MKALVSEFCQINKKCEKLNQKAAVCKSICMIFLQHPSDPFDLFDKPETNLHHIDSKWLTARPKLHQPYDNGPIYTEKIVLMAIMMIKALDSYKLNLKFMDFIRLKRMK